MSIIEVDHLTKEYHLGAVRGLKQTLFNTATRCSELPADPHPVQSIY